MVYASFKQFNLNDYGTLIQHYWASQDNNKKWPVQSGCDKGWKKKSPKKEGRVEKK